MENFYVLPTIEFVAGESQTIIMDLMTPPPDPQPFNANSAVVDFSLINYSNKIGVPIISKLADIRENEDGIPSIAVVRLMPMETVTLFGKYVYQISIIDVDGITEIPMQGIMFIVKNINVGFIKNNLG